MNRLLIVTLSSIIAASALVLAFDVGRGSREAEVRHAYRQAGDARALAAVAERQVESVWMQQAQARDASEYWREIATGINRDQVIDCVVIDAYAAPRPGTSTPQLREGVR